MKTALRILAPIGAAILLFLSLGAWAIASPVGATPDEDFHLSSIWCGQGERDGLCEAGEKAETRLVPTKAIYLLCFVYNPEINASCQGDEFLERGYDLAPTERVNNGQYPGGFFFVTSFLAGDNFVVSVILMRLAHAALFSILAVTSWVLLPRRLRFVLAGAASLTFVPLGMFLVPSVNPSGWSIQSSVLLLPLLLGYFQTRGKTRWALGALAIVAAFLGIESRSDSAAFVLVGAAAAMALCFQHSKRFYLQALLPLGIGVLAVLSVLTAGQTELAASGQLNGELVGENPTSKLALAVLNLATLPSLFAGTFGLGWELGWGDTAMPPAVSIPTFFFFAGALFTALRRVDARKAVAIIGIAFSACFLPVFVLVQSGVVGGFGVQPRYLMPLVVLLLCAALAPTAGAGRAAHVGVPFTPLQLWTIAIGLSATQMIALFTNMRRYITAGSYNLDGSAEWWWNVPFSPFTSLAIGSLSFAGLLALLTISAIRTRKWERETCSATLQPTNRTLD